jgi:hypothetical protein
MFIKDEKTELVSDIRRTRKKVANEVQRNHINVGERIKY